MGRMSDIDIETRIQLEATADNLGLTEDEREEYVTNNYDSVANKIMQKLIKAARQT